MFRVWLALSAAVWLASGVNAQTVGQFAEQFAGTGGDDHDLDNAFLSMVALTPTTYAASLSSTGGNRTTAAQLLSNGYEPLPLGVNGNVQRTLAQPFTFFGVTYNSIFIHSNGYVTFGSTDNATTETIDTHFARPRISALFDNLAPSANSIFFKTNSFSTNVYWVDVPEFGTSSPNTFSIQLIHDSSGANSIQIGYEAVSARDALVGLSAGVGVPPGFTETDVSAFGGFVPASISFSDYSYQVNEDGTPVSGLALSLVRTGFAGQTFAVTVDITAGSAVLVGDYSVPQLVVVFPPNVSRVNLPLNTVLVNDTIREDPESLTLSLLPISGQTPAVLLGGPATVNVTVFDDDRRDIGFSAPTASVLESGGEPTSLQVVTSFGNPNVPVAATITVTPEGSDPATSGEDYNAAMIPVTMAGGVITFDVPISTLPIADLLPEAEETVRLTLTSNSPSTRIDPSSLRVW